MAAHKSLSLRRNMHLGRLSECLHAYQTASEMTVHERAFCGTTCRSNPLFKLDYFLKRKSEHPQSRTDRGRYQDLETGKRESQSFHFKAVIFFRLPVLSLLSPPLKHTCTNTHTHTHTHTKSTKTATQAVPLLFPTLQFISSF